MSYPNVFELQNRMQTSFACLSWVALHEYKRLRAARELRALDSSETDFMIDYEIYHKSGGKAGKESFRHMVLKYFDII